MHCTNLALLGLDNQIAFFAAPPEETFLEKYGDWLDAELLGISDDPTYPALGRAICQTLHDGTFIQTDGANISSIGGGTGFRHDF